MATTTVDPTADGATLEWTSTGGSHYTEIDDGVRDPTAPNTSTNIQETTANEVDIVTCSIASVGDVSDVRVYTHGDDSKGGVQIDISNDGSSWEGAKTCDFGASEQWDATNQTWSTLGWTIDGTLTLYLKVIMSGGASAQVNAIYATVTHTAQASGGESSVQKKTLKLASKFWGG